MSYLRCIIMMSASPKKESIIRVQGSEALRGPSVGLKSRSWAGGSITRSLGGTSGPHLIGRPQNWRTLHHIAGYRSTTLGASTRMVGMKTQRQLVPKSLGSKISGTNGL